MWHGHHQLGCRACRLPRPDRIVMLLYGAAMPICRNGRQVCCTRSMTLYGVFPGPPRATCWLSLVVTIMFRCGKKTVRVSGYALIMNRALPLNRSSHIIYAIPKRNRNSHQISHLCRTRSVARIYQIRTCHIRRCQTRNI